MKKFLFTLTLCAAFIQQTIAQQIDLSQINSAIQTHSISPNQTFTVQVSNMLIYQNYRIEINQRVIPIPVFPNPNDSAEAEDKAVNSLCDELRVHAQGLVNLENETELKSQLNIINKFIKSSEEEALQDSSSKECWGHVKDSIELVMSGSNRILGPFKLERGQELEIKISRGEGDKKKEWVYVYSAGIRGEWQISYGFTFITQAWNPEQIYFTAEDGNGAYLLKKEAQTSNLIYSPSLFFTWMPANRMNQNTSWGISGGLGYDFSKPTLFVGPTLSYNQNIKFHAGVVAHQQKVLNGQYAEGQALSQILTETQLHKEAYQMNLFFSVSFRFDQNPFNRK